MAKRRAPAATPARAANKTPTGKVRRRGALDSAEAAVLFGVLVFLLGGFWDVAWHLAVGRESFWSPPHLVLYSGILLVLGACAYAFTRAWRTGRKVPGAGPFIAAMGAALSLASAPIDDLWHRLYGLDTTILSPPHVMLVAGMAIAAFGALAGFALRANRRDPARLDTLWRSTGGRWAGGGDETGLLLAGGVLLAVVLAVLGEFDFDVSRYPVTWHPVLLSALAAFVLALGARASGRAGAATLMAAVYTGVRLLALLELWALGDALPQIPLVLLAAPAMDLALWWLPGRIAAEQRQRRRWWVPAAGGAAFSAALLLVEWPYTAAWNAVVWRPEVLAVAAAPAVAGAAIAAAVGWLVGSAVRPVRAPAAHGLAGVRVDGDAPRRSATKRPRDNRGGRRTGTPAGQVSSAAWNGWSHGPGRAIIAAGAGLVLFAIAPAIGRGGAPTTLRLTIPADREAIGYLQVSPDVPVVGQPLTLRLTLDDPAPVGAAVALPYETVRAGDVVSGVMRTTGERGVYQVSITPREAGRRWVSVFLEGEEGRIAGTATLVVYRPEEAARRQPLPPRPMLVRPEPGPQVGLPGWLEPLVYAAITALIAGVAVAIGWSLRRATRPPGPPVAPPAPAVGPRAPIPARARA